MNNALPEAPHGGETGRNDLISLKALIAAGADVTTKSKGGLTAYGFAVDNGNAEAAKLLKGAGAR